jgi:4-amino-4-deoxy-L-arabinose transferase-like glycosyltransferase
MAVAAVMVLAHQLFNEGTALIAGVIACIYPGAIGMSVFVLSEAGFCPLMLLTLISWIAAWRTSPFKWQTTFGILTGVAAGVGTLIRPSWLLFVPFCLAFCVVLSPQRIRHFTVGGCVVAGIVISMLPWWIRNYLVTNGKFVPTTLQVGASLYDGLHPGATGASDTGMTFVGRFGREQQEADRASQQPLDGSFEYRLDRRMKEAAIAWAKDNPGRFVQLMGIKLARIWSVWPNAAEMKGWKMGVVVFVGYVPILVLAVVGAWKYLRLGWPYILCVMPAVYFSALHAVFVGSIRYRQPAMLALIVLAAAAIASWYRGAGFKDSETMQTCHE